MTISISAVLGSLFFLCSLTAWLACRRVSFLRRRARARASALLRLGLAAGANVLEPAAMAGVDAVPYFADRDEESALDADISAAEEAVQAPDLQGLSRVLDALVNDAATLNPLFAIIFIGSMAPIVAIVYILKLVVTMIRAVSRAISQAVEAVFDAAFVAYNVVLRAAVRVARLAVISTRAYNLNTGACTERIRALSQKGAFVCGCINVACAARAATFEAWCVNIRAEVVRAEARSRGIIIAESTDSSVAVDGSSPESETGAPRDSPRRERTLSAVASASPSRARVSITRETSASTTPRSPRPTAVAPTAIVRASMSSMISNALMRAWTDDDDGIAITRSGASRASARSDSRDSGGANTGSGTSGGGNSSGGSGGVGSRGDSARRTQTQPQRRPRWSHDDGRWVEEVSDEEESDGAADVVGGAVGADAGGGGGSSSPRSSGGGPSARGSPRSVFVGVPESPRTAASNLQEALADPRVPARLPLHLRVSSADDPAVEPQSRAASEAVAYSLTLTAASRGTDPGTVGSGSGSRTPSLAPKSPGSNGSASPSIASMRAVRGLR